jgi:D-aspartate ligase
MTLPHIVITGSSANALGALRSLHQYSLTLVCEDENSPAWHSRYGKKVRVQSTKKESIVAELCNMAKTLPDSAERPLLLMTEEKTVYQVSLHREKLEQYFQLHLCPHSLLVALQSKEGFQQLAAQANSPVPKGVILRSDDDLVNLNQLQFPCVFKPLEQNEAYGKQFKKAYKVNSIAEVSALYSDICKVMPEMIVQEWLEGADSDIYFCLAFFDQNSTLVSSFTGRKIRSWPLQVGGTASCTAAPEAESELKDLTCQFATAVGYSGLIGMEFKFDVQRKKFFMIEPTVGRTDYQHEVAALCGQNYLAKWVASVYKLPNLAEEKKSSVIWYDEIADAKALQHGAANQMFLQRKRVAAIWRLTDPKPAILRFWRRLLNRLMVQ